MSTLGIDPSVQGDLEFCWSVFLDSANGGRHASIDDDAKTFFAEKWKSRSNCVVNIDGNQIGWFACVVDSENKTVTVEDMYFRPGHVGVPHLILSIIAKDTVKRGRKALWSLPKSHPASAMFKSQAFPLHSESDSHATVEVSIFLERANGWDDACNAALPWNKV